MTFLRRILAQNKFLPQLSAANMEKFDLLYKISIAEGDSGPAPLMQKHPAPPGKDTIRQSLHLREKTFRVSDLQCTDEKLPE